MYDAWACDHISTAVRIRTRSNQAQVYVLQCLVCGSELRSVSKQSPEVLNLAERVPFDEDLGPRWDNEVRQRQIQHYTELRRAEQEERDHAKIQRRAFYESYLRTPEWRAVRQRVLTRSRGMCEGCGERKAAQVHHLTYEHLGNEFLFELVAVCMECHGRIHEREEAA